jgi:type III restriction enzyme
VTSPRVLWSPARGNYYEAFDLVPSRLLPALGRGRFLITNWHAFLPQDDARRRGVVQRGPESDAAFCARVLHDLGSARNLLVLNDEAHHCYRPRPEADRTDGPLSGERRRDAEEQNEAATIRIDGLERINAVRGILACVDLSATPFFIAGSGYPEGTPFPWLVSDFGLVDAIESGIVKVPRVPVASDSGRPDPEYFRLWESIMARLEPHERGAGRRKPKPEAVVREADGALQQVAGEWAEKLREFQRDGYPVPPCLIAVCDNTDISALLYERIAEEGRVFAEHLRNDGREVTLRIDTKLLNKAEEANGEGASREERAEALRRKVATAGKPGEPGGQVRCVVSVGMLTEGWDAQNVTHILGLRAFQSQLLCEQVVGRGLRRMNYDFELDQEGVPRHVEYVDVYGIPFEVIPVKKRPSDRPPPPERETTLVQALREREHLRIDFPRVEGYVYEVRDRVTADVARIAKVRVDPSVEPTQTIVRAKVGYELGAPALRGPGETETQTRAEFYASVRMQEIEYELARRIVVALVGKERFRFAARHTLFPQVLAIVREFLASRVDYSGVDHREVGLERYAEMIVERLLTAIRPAEDGQARLPPCLERFRPRGSTAEVVFRTARECRQTLKSHISHVVLDTARWEASVAFQLEASAHVQSYARNDHLELAIPYTFLGGQHVYHPDYVVRLSNGIHLLLEVKGLETEQDRAKHEAARRWAEAVNTWGVLGRWAFAVCRDPRDVAGLLGRLAGG